MTMAIGLRTTLRILLVWLAVGLFFYGVGEVLVTAMLPLLTWFADGLAEHFQTELSLGENKQGLVINIVARVSQDLYVADYPVAPQGTSLSAAGTLVHVLTPVVIFFTVILSWPGAWQRLATRLLLAVPMAVVIICVTTPPLLVSHIDQILHQALEAIAQRPMPSPFLLRWVMAMELGGIWLVPLVSALGCVGLVEQFFRYRSAKN